MERPLELGFSSMKSTSKLRLLFFVIASLGYLLGSWLMPEAIGNFSSFYSLYEQLKEFDPAALRLALSTTLYFLIIPTAYWILIIRAGSKAKWRIIIVFSLSCFIARYQYPPEIAQYFEFIAWLRYPIVAVLLVIEFYLMFSLARSMWGARKLSSDPRLNILNTYDAGSKEIELGLPMAYEPASWFYAVPKFSRNHPPAIGQLKLLSANEKHFALLLFANILVAFIGYFLLADWSVLAATVFSTLFAWNIMPIIANYRCSKHHSIYTIDGKLVINNSWLGFMAIDLENVKSCRAVKESFKTQDLILGRGVPNIEIGLSKDQIYYSIMGIFSDSVNKVALSVHDSKEVLNQIRANMSYSPESI